MIKLQWCLALGVVCLLTVAAAKPDRVGTWASSNKQFFGTAYETYDDNYQYTTRSATSPLSRVWFTGAQGVLTELYWPSIDNPQTRDTQFLVTDGKSFFFEERNQSEVTVEWARPGVPLYRVLTRDPEGRFEIYKEIVADPDRDAVVQNVKIRRFVPGLRFYLHHNPSAANSPNGDTAFATLTNEPGAGLFAWQGREAQAVIANIPFKEVSAGYEGKDSDGFIDLQDFKLDHQHEWAIDANVVLTGRLDLPETTGETDLLIAIGFDTDLNFAYRTARESLRTGFSSIAEKYMGQWQGYQNSVENLARAGHADLFRASVALTKAMEDKSFAGAFVAAPVVPWGEYSLDSHPGPGQGKPKKEMTGGYHLVWPRDLYQMATSFLAIGDYGSAIASLNYLKRVQLTASHGTWKFGTHERSKDGSWWQNNWIDGTQQWGGVQQDEVGYPILLAYRLWRAGKIQPGAYWDMVRRAGDFIADFGPWTNQERWEDAFGYSPYAIGVQIAALWTAAEFAREMGDEGRAQRFKQTADHYSNHLEAWTFTSTGNLGDGKYYVRIEAAAAHDQKVDPNDDRLYELANGAGWKYEKDVTDGGFLELVRLGVRSAKDPQILDTIREYDMTLKVDVPDYGPGFYRYYGDRYNYDESDGKQTDGMLWPLLTGERGHYELAYEGRPRMVRYIQAVERFASPSFMIPEQVWDQGPRRGTSTGAATPLGWCHGEYIKMLRSYRDGKVFDEIPVVVERRKELKGE